MKTFSMHLWHFQSMIYQYDFSFFNLRARERSLTFEGNYIDNISIILSYFNFYVTI